jgi:hypothetical protein
MKGAIAVVSASKRTAPKTSSMMMIGKSHNFFLVRKNRPNSLTVDIIHLLLELIAHALSGGTGGLSGNPVRVRVWIGVKTQSVLSKEPGHERDRREQQIKHDTRNDGIGDFTDEFGQSHPDSVQQSEYRGGHQRHYREYTADG